MYDIKIIKKALKLLEQFDYSFIKVSRELEIPRTAVAKQSILVINNWQIGRKSPLCQRKRMTTIVSS